MTRILTALAAILLQAIPPFPKPAKPYESTFVPLAYKGTMTAYGPTPPAATYGD
jgi:hypothetical protein